GESGANAAGVSLGGEASAGAAKGGLTATQSGGGDTDPSAGADEHDSFWPWVVPPGASSTGNAAPVSVEVATSWTASGRAADVRLPLAVRLPAVTPAGCGGSRRLDTFFASLRDQALDVPDLEHTAGGAAWWFFDPDNAAAGGSDRRDAVFAAAAGDPSSLA